MRTRVLVCLAFGVVSGCSFDLGLPEGPQTGTVKGVVDPQGHVSAAGQTVTLGGAGKETRIATTDANGAFTFDGLSSGAYSAVVALPGFAELQRTADVKGPSVVDLGVLQPTWLANSPSEGVLSGTVVGQSGADVTGGEIEFTLQATPPLSFGVATLGLSGRFSQRLPPGTYTLTVRHPLYVTATKADVVLAEAARVTLDPITLQLNPATISGHIDEEVEVYQADGGTTVGTQPATSAMVTTDTNATAVVDLAGNFQIMGLPGGTRTLSVVRANHHDTLTLRQVTLAPAEVKTLPAFTLALDRATVKGSVRMGDGTPVANVTVSIPGTPYSTTASADLADPSTGAFVLTGVPPGAYTLRAERPSYIGTSSGVVNVSGNGTVQAGTLPPLTRIQGDFVIDDNDNTNTPGYVRVLNVKLKLSNVANVTDYRAAEGNPTLNGVSFVPFTTSTIDFTLPAGDGTKTVYLQLKDNLNNLSGILSASVVLDTTAPSSPALVIAQGAQFTSLNVTLPVTVTGVETGSGLAGMRLAGSNALDGNGELMAPKNPYFRDTSFTRSPTTDGVQNVYVQLTDNAGNVSGLGSSSIVVDTAPPSGNVTVSQGTDATLAGYTDTIIVELNETAAAEPNGGYVLLRLANETQLDLASAVLQPLKAKAGWLIDTTEGAKTIWYQLVDAAGNASAPAQATIRYDKTPPVGSVALSGATSPTNLQTVTLALTGSDGANPLSPTAALSVSEDPSFTGVTGVPYPAGNTTMFTLSSGDGPKTLFVRLRDAAGNTTVMTLPVVLDRTPPLGSITVAGALADGTLSSTLTSSPSVTVNLAQSGATLLRLGDETLTSCAGGTYSAISGTSVPNVMLTGAAAPRQVRACFKDDAGNTAGPVTATIALDSTTPTGCTLAVTGSKVDGTAAPAGKTARRDVTVSVSGCSETPAEMFLTQASVTCAAATPLAYVPFAASSTFTLTGTDGSLTVRGCVRDAARNTGSAAAASITLDTTAPIAPPSIVIDNNAAYVNLATYQSRGSMFVAPVTASPSGATEWALSETNPPSSYVPFVSPSSFTFGGSGIRTLYARFRDDVGNESAVVSDSIEFDITPPVTTPITIATATNNAFTNSVSVVVQLSGSATDATQVVLAQAASSAACAAGDVAGVSPRVKADVNTFLLTSGDALKRICAQFIDAAGNPSAGLVSATVTLDTVAPTTPQIVTQDTAASIVDNGTFDVTISADSTDLSTVTYQTVGGKAFTWTNTTPLSPRVFRFNVVNDGSETGFRNELRIRAVDQAGNISGDTGVFVTADTNAPEAVTTSPTWLDNGSGAGTVVWQPSTSTDVVSHQIYYDSAGQDPLSGTFAVQGPSPVTTTNPTSFTLSGLANGASVFVRVRPVDHAGNVGPSSPANPGQAPLQLQPNEVSVNQFAALALPASVKRIDRIVVWGNLAYVGATLACGAAADSALAVVDLSNLSSPIANGRVVQPTPIGPSVIGTPLTFTDAVTCPEGEFNVDLQLSPPYLFMTSGTKLRIFNVSVPQTPVLLANGGTIDFGRPLTSFNLIGDRGYVVSGNTSVTYQVAAINLSKLWDNASATFPSIADQIGAPYSPGFTTARMGVVTRDRLITSQAKQGSQLDLLNLSSTLTAAPTAPVYVNSVQLGIATPTRNVVGGNLMYLMSGSGGLTLYDVSQAWTSTSPYISVRAATGFYGGGQFEVDGDQVFGGDFAGSRFRAFNLSDLTAPADVGTYSLGPVPVSATAIYGNYAVVGVDAELRFLELANPRGLRPRASVAIGLNSRLNITPGFIAVGGGQVLDMLAGTAPVREAAPNPWVGNICTDGSAYFPGDLEVFGDHNTVRVQQLEKNMDRNPATSPGLLPLSAENTTFTLAATTRVAGMASYGNFLVVAEHRSGSGNDGVWLEVFDIRSALNRQMGTAIVPATALRGSVKVTGSFAGAGQFADVSMYNGRALVTVQQSFINPPGLMGTYTFIVDIRPFFDDDSTTGLLANPVQASITGYQSKQAMVKGYQPTGGGAYTYYLFIAHHNGMSVVDVHEAFDEDPATVVGASPTRHELFTGQAMDGVWVGGSTLLASGTDGFAGLYSADITNPAAAAIQSVIPLASAGGTCATTTTARNMKSQVTVLGTRAYVVTNQTLRVIELE